MNSYCVFWKNVIKIVMPTIKTNQKSTTLNHYKPVYTWNIWPEQLGFDKVLAFFQLPVFKSINAEHLFCVLSYAESNHDD